VEHEEHDIDVLPPAKRKFYTIIWQKRPRHTGELLVKDEKCGSLNKLIVQILKMLFYKRLAGLLILCSKLIFRKAMNNFAAIGRH
jgi:hypothetical protein